jgi:phosphate transport system substrate-binding protein
MKHTTNLRAAIMAASLCLASAGAFAADITGAGATFPFPLYSKWSEAYKKETGNGLNYQSIGSGGGIKQIQAKTVTFGASDIPQTAEDLSKFGLFQWPMVMGGIVAVVNLEGVKPGELVLDGPALADIYLGKIKKWDDAALKKLNPDVKLPSADIVVVHRADGSGTSFNFTNYLRTGRARSARTSRRNGRRALAPREMKALPVRSRRPRARSVTSNTPMPSRTS